DVSYSYYLSAIEAVAGAVVIHSPTDFSWFGKPSPRLSPRIRQALTPQVARNYLRYALQSQLYSGFYCRGFPTPAPEKGVGLRSAGERTLFTDELSSANSGTGSWEDGWEVRSVTGDAVTVRSQGLELCVRPQDHWTLREIPDTPGTLVSLRRPKEYLQ